MEKEKGKEILTRGGIYLAKLDPAKALEIGKIRPVVVLTAQILLDVAPPIVFTCPLSSRSYPEFRHLHIELAPRDSLEVTSYALVEHSRSITVNRLTYPRIAQLTTQEIASVLSKLQRMLGQ